MSVSQEHLICFIECEHYLIFLVKMAGRLIIYERNKTSNPMPWEVGGEDSDSKENIPTFWDSVEIKPKDVTMTLVDCYGCNKRLRIPDTYSGIITCPNCNKVFKPENEQIGNNLYDSKGRPMVLTNAQRRKGLTPGEQATRVAVGLVSTGVSQLMIFAIIFLFFLIYTIYSW